MIISSRNIGPRWCWKKSYAIYFNQKKSNTRTTKNVYKNNKTILLVIPLLFEAKFEDICTEIWLVNCTEEQQIKRLVKRDQISEEEAYAIIKLQMNFESKTNLSDVILDNSDETNQWINKIKELI